MWADFKSHVKAKLRRNKLNVGGTGGGPSKFIPLSPTEERVVELLQLHTAVDGVANAKSFGIENTVNNMDEIDLTTDRFSCLKRQRNSTSSCSTDALFSTIHDTSIPFQTSSSSSATSPPATTSFTTQTSDTPSVTPSSGR